MKRVLFLIAAILLLPVNASAHSGLLSANPAANIEITTMPAEIELTFTEELMTIGEESVNTISLVDPNGAQIALERIQVRGSLLTAIIPESEYASGSYTVNYKIVSADGHKLSESYSFSLNAPVPVVTSLPVEEEESSALPLPIVIAVAALIALGGFMIYSKGRREE
jgi:methionine-rich copper-binding protein CopC